MKACPICGRGESRFERQLLGMTLAKCPSCSFVYLDLPDEEIEAANSSPEGRVTMYDSVQTGVDRYWHAHLVTLFTKMLGRPGRVLDVGCGNGLLLKAFKDRGWTPYGVDLSSWAEPFAKQYGFSFFHGTLEKSGLEYESFDLVMNLSVFEHVTRPVEFVRTLAKYVRPGGYGYMAGVPNYGSLSVRWGVSAFHHNVPPKHCNYFSPRAIKALEKQVGPGIRVISKTYGIPELHRFYNWTTALKKRSRADTATKSPVDTKPKQARSSDASFLSKAAVMTNYYAGRLAGLGDKLEVYVLKT